MGGGAEDPDDVIDLMDSASVGGETVPPQHPRQFDTRQSLMNAFTGPLTASHSDLETHTLPVASVVPLHMSLTLNEFEDVLAEAIYYGAQLGPKQGVEQHPKEEAKVRAIQAAETFKKRMSEGYFLH